MIHLLIDSCSLLKLINSNGYNPYLSDLENWIKSERIKLHTHELIIEEWQRHKDDRKRKAEKKLKGKKLLNEFPNDNTSSNSLPANFPINVYHLEHQIIQIDSLLKNAQIHKTSEGIKNEFAGRFRDGLAPFHNKKDSQNDWEIIGTVCSYCENYNIKQLVFISDNHTDFADNLNINRKIHPDIQLRFSQTEIIYFKAYSDFFNSIDQIDIRSFRPQRQILQTNEKYVFKSSLKKSDLESLYYVFNDLYCELNFIPIHILRKYYPLSKTSVSDNYYSLFTLYNVSDKLISFFENIIFEPNTEVKFKNEEQLICIDDYLDKTKNVLERLTNNLIFNVGEKDNQKVINIHYNKLENCDCVCCLFNRMEFHKIFKNINNATSNELNILFKQAFINFQLGNLKTAYRQFLDISILAFQQKKYISYFIARYNLKNLRAYLTNPFFNREFVSTEIEFVDIDLMEDAVYLKPFTDYILLNYIIKEEYITDAFFNITKRVEDIVNHYNIQARGGWSSNSHIWELIVDFAKFENFMISNYIVYENFSEIEKLFELVTEGILASHAISEGQGERFAIFDDYWLHKFIIYGKSKTIIKNFNRFKLKFLKYKSSSHEGDTFMEIAKNFLLNESRTVDAFYEYADKENRYFIFKYDLFFENIVTLASLIELDPTMLSEFGNLLLTFLENERTKNHTRFEVIRYFIKNKLSQFDDLLISRFVNYFISKSGDHEYEMFETFFEAISKNQLLQLSDFDFTSLLSGFKESCRVCRRKHSPELLTFLYTKLDTSRKEIISKFISEEINSQFSFDLFYFALILNVISLDTKRLNQLIKSIDTKIKIVTFRSIFSEYDNYQREQVDKIINICFKFNLRTNTKRFNNIKNIHPYYTWLLDMENFDYSKFNTHWVLNYKTTFYYKRMSKSKTLIEKLFEYVKSNPSSEIEKVLLKIIYFRKH